MRVGARSLKHSTQMLRVVDTSLTSRYSKYQSRGHHVFRHHTLSLPRNFSWLPFISLVTCPVRGSRKSFYNKTKR